MDWLQCIFWAGALWGCIDYVNAMYNIYQDYAYRKVLIYLCLVLLTMCGKKSAFPLGKSDMACCFRCGRIFVLPPFPRDRRAGQARHAECHPFCSGGPGADSAGHYYMEEKKRRGSSFPRPLRFLLPPFCPSSCFSEYERLACLYGYGFTLLYIFYLSWEKKERFLGILCNGIILNFSVP